MVWAPSHLTPALVRSANARYLPRRGGGTVSSVALYNIQRHRH